MIKKLITLTVMSTAIISGSFNIIPKALTINYCPKCNIETMNIDEDIITDDIEKEEITINKESKTSYKEDIRMLSCDKYLKYLSDEDKKYLKEINDLIENDKELSKSQQKTLISIKDKALKGIINDKDNKTFKKFIKK